MSDRPDPGGVFASDTHRRVLAHLHDVPQSPHDLFDRIEPDQHTELQWLEIGDVLCDLEADGHAAQTNGDWVMTPAGLDALNAPVPEAAA